MVVSLDTGLAEAEGASKPEVLALLRRHWGHEGFLSGQAEAVGAVLARRDSLVVLPTGGGKSVCYQLPALALPGTALVISPLLALMKDQVDALRDMGISAASYNSMMDGDERRAVADVFKAGQLKLLYLAPEALAAPHVRELLHEAQISFIAVDEAHCISQWGHDYRPDYRNLGPLRGEFPGTPVHAFTATATPGVQGDITSNLRMQDPLVWVGDVDRPNLVYRARSRHDTVAQVLEVARRHPGEAGIVYCISRKETESLAERLRTQGLKARPYHAGLDPKVRRANQEAFAKEEIDLIVATVAFGMGIDRSDVRFVVHAGLPKSIEAYQQESGRAGRDRLEAECVLLFAAQDFMALRRLLLGGAGEAGSEAKQAEVARLGEVYRFARSLVCRHRFLVGHFGQDYPERDCGACDVCLGEHAEMPDGHTLARKLLSGVARLKRPFGASYVAEVLKGAQTARIKELGHDQLSTHGLLKEHATKDIQDWLDQLEIQGHLSRDPEYGTLSLTPPGVALLKGVEAEDALTVRLSMPQSTTSAPAKKRLADGGGELSPGEEALFEAFRVWRREVAKERGLAPYMVLADAPLRALARQRPTTRQGLFGVKGLGESKVTAYGAEVLALLAKEGDRLGLLPGDAPAWPSAGESAAAPGHLSLPLVAGPTPSKGKPKEGLWDAFADEEAFGEEWDEALAGAGEGPAGLAQAALPVAYEAPPEEAPKPRSNPTREACFDAFDANETLEAVALRLGKAESTITGYLMEYLERSGRTEAQPWVDRLSFARVTEAALRLEAEGLKPIFEALNGAVPYEQIRIALMVRANQVAQAKQEG